MSQPLPILMQDMRCNPEDYGMEPRLPEVFSSSSLRDYVLCQSLFYARKILRRVPTGPEKPHFAFGRVWHYSLYAYNGQEDPVKGLEAALATIDEIFPEDILNETDDKGRTKDRMVQMFVKYVSKYGTNDIKHRRVVRREQYFRIKCEADDDCVFGGCDLEWHGRFDLIDEDLSSERIRVWDYKHSTYKMARYYDKAKHGFQFPGYVWAVAHMQPGWMPDAVLDLAHVLKNTENYERETFRYSPVRIIQWRENVKRIIAEIQEKYERHSHEPWAWTQNREACLDKWPCDYSPVHVDAPDIEDTWLMILEQNYTEDTYDPSKDLEGL